MHVPIINVPIMIHEIVKLSIMNDIRYIKHKVSTQESTRKYSTEDDTRSGRVSVGVIRLTSNDLPFKGPPTSMSIVSSVRNLITVPKQSSFVNEALTLHA